MLSISDLKKNIKQTLTNNEPIDYTHKMKINMCRLGAYLYNDVKK